jgi:hypothetical protein
MVVGTSLTLLTPRAAVVGLVGVVAIAATVAGRRRAETVRRTLQLPHPQPGRARARLALVVAFVSLLTLTAAQPALTRDHHLRVRRDAQVLFVLDVSRSMAASAKLHSPTRLDRAAAAAAQLRGTVPTVAAGVAGLTDRVLPYLFPVPGRAGFDQVVHDGVAIENPPPQASAVRATTYDALQQIPEGGFFDPRARSRVVVVLTDGESNPVQTAEVAAAFARHPGYHVLFVRFWRPDEAIYDADGQVESAYRPDPSGAATLDTLASALGGQAYGENDLGRAGRTLHRLVGSGPVTDSGTTVRTQTPLGPYTAGLALVAATGLILLSGAVSSVRWLFR